MTNDSEIAKLQAKVGEFKAIFAKKDTLIAKYKALVEENEGEII